MSGSGNFEMPQNFAAHAGDGAGVIVVTMNYRLNIFGFLATAELSATQGGVSGNYGIQDQQAALVWIQVRAAT